MEIVEYVGKLFYYLLKNVFVTSGVLHILAASMILRHLKGSGAFLPFNVFSNQKVSLESE